jgi:hypothetical protein
VKIFQTQHLKAHSEKTMMINHSLEITPKISKEWIEEKELDRIKKIEAIIKQNTKYDLIKVISCNENGNVEINLPPAIKVGERGLYILDFEKWIKESIDHGLTVWCRPLGDKNSLRNLRGIQIK